MRNLLPIVLVFVPLVTACEGCMPSPELVSPSEPGWHATSEWHASDETSPFAAAAAQRDPFGFLPCGSVYDGQAMRVAGDHQRDAFGFFTCGSTTAPTTAPRVGFGSTTHRPVMVPPPAR